MDFTSSKFQLKGSKSTPIPSNNDRNKKKIKPLPQPPMPPLRKQSMITAMSQPGSSQQPSSLPRSKGGISKLNVLRESRLHQVFNYKAPPSARLKSHAVGFAEYGPKNGFPVFIIGGYGCTRLVGIMFEEMAYRFGLRMIWPERPGYGLSDECNSQDISALEWADVVIQLSDYLNIHEFHLIAQSVGTVFALAIAHRYKKRIRGPVYLVSPWVSTKAANTFKWSRRLPTPLVTKTISLALDVMWMFNRGGVGGSTSSSNTSRSSKSDDDAEAADSNSRSFYSLPSSPPNKNGFRNTMMAFEEDELLASLEANEPALTTDFPTQRPLRHFVRPQHMSLYLAMNQLRTSENHNQGQLCDVMVALEKHHMFGFSYSDIRTPVSAVWGDKDGLIPLKAIDILANSLPDVRLKILESEGHDLVWKEGVMEWAMRGIAEKYKYKQQYLYF